MPIIRVLIIGLIFYCSLQISPAYSQDGRILFIGNSFTFGNDMPQIFRAIASAQGHNFEVAQLAVPAFTLAQHSARKETYELIGRQKWDYIILQEQSQQLTFSESRIKSGTVRAIKHINQYIKKTNPTAQTYLLVTWGYKNGDPRNCMAIPIVCTYDGMQKLIFRRAKFINDNTGVAPITVGYYWQQMISKTNYNLYSEDNRHPSWLGSYIAATTVVKTLLPFDSEKLPALKMDNQTLEAVKTVMH